MATLLEQAVAYIRAGDIDKGRQLLIEVLKQNPRDENAWLWMTRCVSDPEQKRYCFEKVLKINPQNQHAIAGLKRLDHPARPPTLPEAAGKQPVEKKQQDTTETAAEPQRGETILNSAKKFWDSGITGKALIGFASLIVFCCLGGIPFVVFRPNTPRVAPTQIVSHPVATQTEIATEIPLPTGTPAPTNTPEPTTTRPPTIIETLAPLLPSPIIPQTALGASCIPNNPPQTGQVVDVVDGDTIKVLLDQDGQTYIVRYIGMDTPENTSQVEYMGAEASAKNAELVYGKNVTLIKDVSETDQYGRLLRYVLVENIFVNYELVVQGYATNASYPPDIACILVFQEAEQRARASGVGLWSTPPTQVRLPTLDVSGGDAPCNCKGPDLDCRDFSSHSSAQACYNYCASQGYGDVFRLDGSDNDGKACEALP